MNPNQPKQYFAANHRAVAYDASVGAAIEWEELPSLVGSLSKRQVARGSLARAAAASLGDHATSAGELPADFETSSVFAAPWNSTMAATLDTLPPSQPFSEALHGMAMREVHEPDVFRHFFGPAAPRG